MPLQCLGLVAMHCSGLRLHGHAYYRLMTAMASAVSKGKVAAKKVLQEAPAAAVVVNIGANRLLVLSTAVNDGIGNQRRSSCCQAGSFSSNVAVMAATCVYPDNLQH